jgi:hypothetical protein
LSDHLPDDFVALHQFLIARNTDLDVLVVGPNGIWILESKYWSGTISCKNGEWQRIKDYYETGGYESTKEDRIDKPFDEEWNYEEETIRNRLAPIKQGSFYVEILKGGLVFTHPDVQLDIDSSCQVEFGKTHEWVEKIMTDPVVPEFTIRNILSVVDRLLSFADPLEGITSSSANTIPETLYSDNKQSLETFRKHVISLLV